MINKEVKVKNIYFLSDAHLGSLAIPHGRMQERRLVRFLDSIKMTILLSYGIIVMQEMV